MAAIAHDVIVHDNRKCRQLLCHLIMTLSSAVSAARDRVRLDDRARGTIPRGGRGRGQEADQHLQWEDQGHQHGQAAPAHLYRQAGRGSHGIGPAAGVGSPHRCRGAVIVSASAQAGIGAGASVNVTGVKHSSM